MVEHKKVTISKPDEKKSNSNLIIDEESDKISQDSTTNKKNDFNLDYLDWIIDKGWLRTKK